MPAPFDPYHRWLGIPPKHQPPDHYRLLGVTLFESDAEVIESAANQRVAYIKTHRSGEHAAVALQLLKQVAAAQFCLLDAAKKAAYDKTLGGGSSPTAADMSPSTRKPEPVATAKTADAKLPNAFVPSTARTGSALVRRRASRQPKNSMGVVVGVLAGGGLALAIVFFFVVYGRGGGQTSGTVVLDLPEGKRHTISVEFDGHQMTVPPRGPWRYECAPGKHRLIVSRAGYQAVEAEVFVEVDEPLVLKPPWRPVEEPDTATPTGIAAVDTSRESVGGTVGDAGHGTPSVADGPTPPGPFPRVLPGDPTPAVSIPPADVVSSPPNRPSLPAVELPPGLVGYWRLDRSDARGDDVLLDATGRFEGKIHGDPTWVAGRVDDALLFDGAGDYISLGSPPELDITGDITLAAWVRIDSATGFHNILCRGHCYSPQGDLFLRLSSRGYTVGSWNGDGHETAYTMAPDDIGQWVHLAGTHDGRFWRLFRNGDPLSYKFDSVGALAVEAEWAIGGRGKPFHDDPPMKRGDGNARFFRGAIDEVRIYNRVLDGLEIRKLVTSAP